MHSTRKIVVINVGLFKPVLLGVYTVLCLREVNVSDPYFWTAFMLLPEIEARLATNSSYFVGQEENVASLIDVLHRTVFKVYQ